MRNTSTPKCEIGGGEEDRNPGENKSKGVLSEVVSELGGLFLCAVRRRRVASWSAESFFKFLGGEGSVLVRRGKPSTVGPRVGK